MILLEEGGGVTLVVNRAIFGLEKTQIMEVKIQARDRY